MSPDVPWELLLEEGEKENSPIFPSDDRGGGERISSRYSNVIARSILVGNMGRRGGIKRGIKAFRKSRIVMELILS